MPYIIENILVMVLTIVVLIGGGYLLLLLLGWGLKIKSGKHEQVGLTSLWIEAQKEKSSDLCSQDTMQEDR